MFYVNIHWVLRFFFTDTFNLLHKSIISFMTSSFNHCMLIYVRTPVNTEIYIYKCVISPFFDFFFSLWFSYLQIIKYFYEFFFLLDSPPVDTFTILWLSYNTFYQFPSTVKFFSSNLIQEGHV